MYELLRRLVTTLLKRCRVCWKNNWRDDKPNSDSIIAIAAGVLTLTPQMHPRILLQQMKLQVYCVATR